MAVKTAKQNQSYGRRRDIGSTSPTVNAGSSAYVIRFPFASASSIRSSTAPVAFVAGARSAWKRLSPSMEIGSSVHFATPESRNHAFADVVTAAKRNDAVARGANEVTARPPAS